MLTFEDIEVIKNVLDWTEAGFKQAAALELADAEAAAEFMGIRLEAGEDSTTEDYRETILAMRDDVIRVRRKIKKIYGV